MILFSKLICEDTDTLTLYRGVDPKFGDTDHGRMSIGVKHKLVGALGPNYTDNPDVAKSYGGKVIEKIISPNRVLSLSDYDDIIRLYQKYEKELFPDLARKIKGSSSDQRKQFEYIKEAAKMLRGELSKTYDAVKAPIGSGDAQYLKSKGIDGNMNLYILLI